MKKVLIAEDDRIFSKLLATKLEKYGDQFEVLVARDGQEAVELLEKTRVSVLVTDIQMPRMDGFELLAHVNEHHPVIPCFVMTSQSQPEVKKRMPRDLVRFFSKPFEADALARQILHVLGRNIPQGVVRGISVVSFLRMIALEQKTCLLEVTAPKTPKGLFYFEKGVLFDAVYGDIKAEDAAVAAMAGKQATFRFRRFPDRKMARHIMTPLDDLITRALARQEAVSDNDWEDIFAEVLE